MFGYVSIAQLAAGVRGKIHLVPGDVDLIVGIPRSGMIPAYMIGLFLNRLVVDLETFLRGGTAAHGSTRSVGVELTEPMCARHILLVDDSIATGASMRGCMERIRTTPFAGRITTFAAIVDPEMRGSVDLFLTDMPHPRVFEWNAFHHPEVKNACFDLDGVLCIDPSAADNDDGPRYRQFIRTARPRFKPTQRLGHIVSARLERYRDLTEEWLAANEIDYGQLHLIDLPSQAERVRLRAHCAHKARIYRRTDAFLFFESDAGQAAQIAALSGKPVLCVENMSLYRPIGLRSLGNPRSAKWQLKRVSGRMKAWLRANAPLSGERR